MEHVLTLSDNLSLSILVRLPGAHLNERVVGIAKVNHQEQIALVAIARGVPVLFQGDAVHIVILRMLHHLYLVEFHVNILRVLEDARQIGDILRVMRVRSLLGFSLTTLPVMMSALSENTLFSRSMSLRL